MISLTSEALPLGYLAIKHLYIIQMSQCKHFWFFTYFFLELVKVSNIAIKKKTPQVTMSLDVIHYKLFYSKSLKIIPRMCISWEQRFSLFCLLDPLAPIPGTWPAQNKHVVKYLQTHICFHHFQITILFQIYI